MSITQRNDDLNIYYKRLGTLTLKIWKYTSFVVFIHTVQSHNTMGGN